MMKLLLPLGLLGLLSILVLIIIYLIKPNYEQKFISSTYVWQLSLKYAKKRVPMSKLRNILLIICQVLLLASCAMILAKPYIAEEQETPIPEQIMLIDASASMYAKTTDGGNMTRFERAVHKVEDFIPEAVTNGGLVSIMLVDDNPRYVLQRQTIDDYDTIMDCLNELILPDNMQCSFGSPDIEAAMDLCEDITATNPYAKVTFFTDTEYRVKGDVAVEDVKGGSGEEEWNAAILDGRVSRNKENTFRFDLDIALYNKTSEPLCLEVTVNNAVTQMTPKGGTAKFVYTFSPPYEELVNTVMIPQDMYIANADGTYTLNEAQGEVYINEELQSPNTYVEIYSYESVQAILKTAQGNDLNDSLSYDNSFWFFGGKVPNLKIEYCSVNAKGEVLPNPFVRSLVSAAKTTLASKWDYTLTTPNDPNTFKTEGYDVYIFEHTVPKVLPSDGLVILFDPQGTAPAGSGLNFEEVTSRATFFPVMEHPILRNVNASAIEVTKYVSVNADDNYKVLMRCEDNPVVLVNEREKVFIASINVHFTQDIITALPIMMCNVLNYFYPETVSGYKFDVNDTVAINAIGESITVSSPLGQNIYTEFPLTIPLEAPGQYYVYQQSLSNQQLMTSFFVKLPSMESDITAEADELVNPYFEPIVKTEFMDELLLYFAIALVALIVAEWWLQSRSQF